MAVGNELTINLEAKAADEVILHEDVVIDQDVYEVYKIVVPKSSVVAQIDILQAPTNLVVIMADRYVGLTYKVHEVCGSAITLYCIQVFTGFDMVGKLGTLDALLFYNSSTLETRTVTVIIAWDKTKT